MDRDFIQLNLEEDDNKFTRDRSRWGRLNHATGTLRRYFIDEGDSSAMAKVKINQLSNEVSESGGEPIFNYIMGNKKPMRDKVQASVLSFMDQDAKDVMLNVL